jgi:hypothetical protein
MTTASQPSILNPRSDIWLTGGLSVVVLVALAAFGLLGSREFLLQEFLILTVLLNGTHFMASYRLLYSSREHAAKYPWASFYVPGFLVIWMLAGIGLCSYNSEWTLPLHVLTATATLYLALHYTGQAWGMVSSFAFLEGVRFEPSERRMLRFFLRCMAVWHVVWGMKLLWPPAPQYTQYVLALDSFMNMLAVGSLLGGLRYFRRVGNRLGRRVPLRVVMPYVALHVWYGFLYLFPQSIFWVQIFHALQYLPFPLRVELNRTQRLEGAPTRWDGALTYIVVLVVTSALVFGLVPWLSKGMGQGAYSVWVAIASVINIHHYFIDGCIWHISNPVVSKELFSHTRPVAATSVSN